MAHCHVIFVFCVEKSSQQQPATATTANSQQPTAYCQHQLLYTPQFFAWYVGFLFGEGKGDLLETTASHVFLCCFLSFKRFLGL